MIKIEKNVPLPDGNQGRKAKYPWQDMNIGDSFFAEKKSTVISATAFGAGRRTGFKFVVRTVTENGVKGTRVWRIA